MGIQSSKIYEDFAQVPRREMLGFFKAKASTFNQLKEIKLSLLRKETMKRFR